MKNTENRTIAAAEKQMHLFDGTYRGYAAISANSKVLADLGISKEEMEGMFAECLDAEERRVFEYVYGYVDGKIHDVIADAARALKIPAKEKAKVGELCNSAAKKLEKAYGIIRKANRRMYDMALEDIENYIDVCNSNKVWETDLYENYKDMEAFTKAEENVAMIAENAVHQYHALPESKRTHFFAVPAVNQTNFHLTMDDLREHTKAVLSSTMIRSVDDWHAKDLMRETSLALASASFDSVHVYRWALENSPIELVERIMKVEVTRLYSNWLAVFAACLDEYQTMDKEHAVMRYREIYRASGGYGTVEDKYEEKVMSDYDFEPYKFTLMMYRVHNGGESLERIPRPRATYYGHWNQRRDIAKLSCKEVKGFYNHVASQAVAISNLRAERQVAVAA